MPATTDIPPLTVTHAILGTVADKRPLPVGWLSPEAWLSLVRHNENCGGVMFPAARPLWLDQAERIYLSAESWRRLHTPGEAVIVPFWTGKDGQLMLGSLAAPKEYTLHKIEVLTPAPVAAPPAKPGDWHPAYNPMVAGLRWSNPMAPQHIAALHPLCDGTALFSVEEHLRSPSMKLAFKLGGERVLTFTIDGTLSGVMGWDEEDQCWAFQISAKDVFRAERFPSFTVAMEGLTSLLLTVRACERAKRSDPVQRAFVALFGC
jgi:hypothetical protein